MSCCLFFIKKSQSRTQKRTGNDSIPVASTESVSGSHNHRPSLDPTTSQMVSASSVDDVQSPQQHPQHLQQQGTVVLSGGDDVILQIVNGLRRDDPPENVNLTLKLALSESRRKMIEKMLYIYYKCFTEWVGCVSQWYGALR